MDPVLEKPSQSSSVITESNARVPAVLLEATHPRDNNSTNYAHNLNEQQTNTDPTTPIGTSL